MLPRRSQMNYRGEALNDSRVSKAKSPVPEACLNQNPLGFHLLKAGFLARALNPLRLPIPLKIVAQGLTTPLQWRVRNGITPISQTPRIDSRYLKPAPEECQRYSPKYVPSHSLNLGEIPNSCNLCQLKPNLLLSVKQEPHGRFNFIPRTVRLYHRFSLHLSSLKYWFGFMPRRF